VGGVGSALPVADTADESPEPLSLVEGTVLATGCLTVIAAALDGECPVGEIVWMGGAVAVGGNMTAAAEFNAWLDPEAADQVLSSGVPISMVPLDITHQVSLACGELDELGGYGRLAAIAARACAFL
jgi:inosine-uridine nucleoside N-ribohydrolase